MKIYAFMLLKNFGVWIHSTNLIVLFDNKLTFEIDRNGEYFIFIAITGDCAKIFIVICISNNVDQR